MKRIAFNIIIILITQFVFIIKMHGQTVVDHPVYGATQIVDNSSIKFVSGFSVKNGAQLKAYIDNVSKPSLTPAYTIPNYESGGSDNYNFITTKKYLSETASDFSEEIRYFDGLGNLRETILTYATPEGKNLVDLAPYPYGRQRLDYLPITRDNYSVYPLFHDVESCANSVEDFYQSIGFSENDLFTPLMVFEGSYLRQEITEYGTGSSHDSYGKEYNYSLNDKVVTGWDADGSQKKYPIGSLMIFETLDENYSTSLNQNESIIRQYKDHEGKVILSESVLKTVGEYEIVLETYYAYDVWGRLVLVVPPLADSPTHSDLCYKYEYDIKGRLLSKKLPGAEKVNYVYDAQDRLVLEQDGNLNTDKYRFYKYDGYGRQIMSGILSTTFSLATLRTKFASFAKSETNSSSSSSYNSYYSYSLNESYPAGITISTSDVQNVIWYDDYQFINGLNAANSFNCDTYDGVSQLSCSPSNSVGDLVTGRLVKTLGDENFSITNSNIITVSYYDEDYNNIRTITKNHKGNFEVSSTVYKPVSKWVLNTEQIIYTNSSDRITVKKDYIYDRVGRLLETDYSINGGNPIVLNANRYNELGQLEKKFLFSTNSGSENMDFAQEINYQYNLKGWLTAINDVDLENSGSDLFGMQIFYENQDASVDNLPYYKPQFNGNVSALKWNTTFDKVRGYGYEYDNISRLLSGYYGDGNNLNYNANKNNEEITNYDYNGNILGLKRKLNGVTVDNLTYNYNIASNQIKKITDAVQGDPANVSDYVVRSSSDYAYDNNGNMKSDPGKDIDIIYNELNLPEKITFPGGNKIYYLYDAAGNKLAQLVEANGIELKKTEYISNTVFIDGSLESILNEEGYVTQNGSNTWKYFFYLKDHLGNVRVVFTTNDENANIVETVQTNNYYPFGLPFETKNYPIANTGTEQNNYLYNGKELQNEGFNGVSLDWYDFGFRFYDPALGRFPCMDPIIEAFPSHTPYNYAFSNPTSMIDLWGLQGVFSHSLAASRNQTAEKHATTPEQKQELRKARIIAAVFVNLPAIPALLAESGVIGTANTALNGSSAYEAADNLPEVEDPTFETPEPAELEEPNEGVYEFEDTEGKDYTGQSKDIDRRMKEHEYSGKKDPNTKEKRTGVTGGKTKREKKETEILDSKGGPDTKSNPNPNVSNKKRPISRKREEDMKKNGTW